MQNVLRRAVKVFSYIFLAFLAFCTSYLLGGSRNPGMTRHGSEATTALPDTPFVYADAPYAGSGEGGGGGGGEGGSEGGGGEGGSSSGGEGG